MFDNVALEQILRMEERGAHNCETCLGLAPASTNRKDRVCTYLTIIENRPGVADAPSVAMIEQDWRLSSDLTIHALNTLQSLACQYKYRPRTGR